MQIHVWIFIIKRFGSKFFSTVSIRIHSCVNIGTRQRRRKHPLLRCIFWEHNAGGGGGPCLCWFKHNTTFGGGGGGAASSRIISMRQPLRHWRDRLQLSWLTSRALVTKHLCLNPSGSYINVNCLLNARGNSPSVDDGTGGEKRAGRGRFRFKPLHRSGLYSFQATNKASPGVHPTNMDFCYS